jgi:hypothetical protein
MEKITTFNKANLKDFGTEFKKAVAELEAKIGVKIDLGNISFNDHQFTSKVTVTLVGDGLDSADAKMKVEFERYALLFGLNKADYDKQFTYGGKRYKLKGVKPRSTKNPFVAQEISNGKLYVLPNSALNFITA